jgi:glycerol transport system ATP-binding protein
VRHPAEAKDFALKEMNHVWEDGEAYALLGPSGCGKTTLLNIISGLISPSAGRVLFDGRDVTDLPTRDRNIAQVFQFPVVYDTMTVYDNLAFPLCNRKSDEPTIRSRVQYVAEMLDLTPLLDRRTGGIGADARQKTSMGRGLVRTDVSAILFDEPLTAIDPHLKISLRRHLKRIHQQLQLTMVYVTHDQTEALTFADTVVVMHEGVVVQVGTPQALFERPAHTFVGHFIGSPGMNLVACETDGPFALVKGHRIRLADETAERARGAAGRLELGIRPEYLRLVFDEPKDGIRAKITVVEELGSHSIVTVAMDDISVRVRMNEEDELRGDLGWLVFPAENSLLFRDSRLV